MEKAVENIRKELKKYLKNSGLKSLVIGVSGGIDSALCCALAYPVCEELKIPLIGRYLSIQSNKEEEKDRAIGIGENFCHKFEEYNMISEYEVLKNVLGQIPEQKDEIIKFKIRGGNIKARLRMIYLYNLASKNQGMVLSTDNYTEYLQSFWTIAGDIGDFGMIQNLWKTEVYNMTEWIAENETCNALGAFYLKECITADATDGLGITSTDLDQIIPDWKERHTTTRGGYAEVDEILKKYIKLSKEIENNWPPIELYELNELKKSPVIIRMINSEFKRNIPYNIPRENIL